MRKNQFVTILIAITIFAGCASVSTKVMRAEKERTDAAIGIIDSSNLPEPEKKILTAEFHAKDQIIDAQASAISNAETKTKTAETKVQKAEDKNVSLAMDAGYGHVLKWILGLGIAGVILFIAFKVAKRLKWL